MHTILVWIVLVKVLNYIWDPYDSQKSFWYISEVIDCSKMVNLGRLALSAQWSVLRTTYSTNNDWKVFFADIKGHVNSLSTILLCSHIGWNSFLAEKMEVVKFYTITTYIWYKHASISFFVCHGPQEVITFVQMVLFESLVYFCD